MRVLTVTPIYPGKAFPAQGVFVHERQRHLPKDIDVTVVRARPYFPGLAHFRRHLRSDIPAIESVDGIAVHDLRFFYIPGVLKGLDGTFLLHALAEFWRTHGPFDLIDAHFLYPTGFAAAELARRVGVPAVVTERGTAASYVDLARRARMRSAIDGATRLVTVSASLAEVCRSIAGRALDVRVIPNGVDGDVFHPGDAEEARRSVGLSGRGPFLLTVGGLVPRKGVLRVLEVLPELIGRFPDLRYVVVGAGGVEGDYEAAIRARIESAGLSSHVVLVGAVDHARLAAYYRAADLFVLSTSNEGWANVLQESLASGTPVVTTDVGGNREVVGDENQGRIVPFGDPAALLAAIRDGLGRTYDRARIAAYGRRRTWKNVGEDVAQVYREALLGR